MPWLLFAKHSHFFIASLHNFPAQLPISPDPIQQQQRPKSIQNSELNGMSRLLVIFVFNE
jgi:hypothetical protein